MYFFAYGMLTDTDFMPRETLAYYGAASLQDYELEMLTYANLIPSTGSTALGVLYEVNEKVLVSLDYMEGYPVLYTRKLVPVQCQNVTVDAWVYLMTEKSRAGMLKRLPPRHYVATVRKGYRETGMSTQSIDDALRSAQLRAQGA